MDRNIDAEHEFMKYLAQYEHKRKLASASSPPEALHIDSPIIKEVVDSYRAHYIAKYAAEEARAQTGGISLTNLSGLGEQLTGRVGHDYRTNQS